MASGWSFLTSFAETAALSKCPSVRLVIRGEGPARTRLTGDGFSRRLSRRRYIELVLRVGDLCLGSFPVILWLRLWSSSSSAMLDIEVAPRSFDLCLLIGGPDPLLIR